MWLIKVVRVVHSIRWRIVVGQWAMIWMIEAVLLVKLWVKLWE